MTPITAITHRIEQCEWMDRMSHKLHSLYGPLQFHCSISNNQIFYNTYTHQKIKGSKWPWKKAEPVPLHKNASRNTFSSIIIINQVELWSVSGFVLFHCSTFILLLPSLSVVDLLVCSLLNRVVYCLQSILVFYDTPKWLPIHHHAWQLVCVSMC